MQAHVFTVTDEHGKEIARATLECDDLDAAIGVVERASYPGGGGATMIDPLRFLIAVRAAQNTEGVTVKRYIGVAFSDKQVAVA